MLVAVVVAAVACEQAAALVGAVQCVPAGLAEAARCAEQTLTEAVRLRATAWPTPGPSSESRTQSQTGPTSAGLGHLTWVGLADPTSVYLADPATGLAGTEAGPEEAGAEIIGRDMVGVQQL